MQIFFIKVCNYNECKLKNEKFKQIESLDEFNEQLFENGFFSCLNCKLFFHKKCILSTKLEDAKQSSKRKYASFTFTSSNCIICINCDEVFFNF